MNVDDSNSQLGIQYLNIAEYDGGNDMQRELLAPAVPAIYMWVHDFIRLLGLREHIVEDAFHRFQNQHGRKWQFNGDHFTDGHIWVARPKLHEHRRDSLVREISRRTMIGQSIATLATWQQRPLYCGITVNLGRRISEHLEQKTVFAKSLTTISLSECAVLWMQVEDAEADEASALNRERQDQSDGAESESGDVLEADDELLARQVPILNAFESLMIRVAMPIKNKLLDS